MRKKGKDITGGNILLLIGDVNISVSDISLSIWCKIASL